MKQAIFLIPLILSSNFLIGQSIILHELLNVDIPINNKVKVDSIEETKFFAFGSSINPPMNSVKKVKSKCKYKDNLIIECKSFRRKKDFTKTTFQYNQGRRISKKKSIEDSNALVIKYDTLGMPIWAIRISKKDTIILESAYYQKDSILINIYDIKDGVDKYLMIDKIDDQNNFVKSKSKRSNGKRVQFVLKDPRRIDTELVVKYKLDKNMNWIHKNVAIYIQGENKSKYRTWLSNTKRKIHYR